MRAGFSPTVLSWLRRADPLARLMLEAAVTTQADVKQRATQWSAADSTTNFEITSDGTVRLSGSPSTLVSSTSQNGFLTQIDGRFQAVPFYGAELTFTGAVANNAQISRVVAYIDPAQGGAQQVVFLECHLYQVSAVDPAENAGADNSHRLMELCDPIRIVAPTAAGTVTFDFVARGVRPPISPVGPFGQTSGVLFVEIRGLTVTGASAGYVGWGRDTTVPSVSNANVSMTTAGYITADPGYFSRLAPSPTSTPYVTVDLVSYVSTQTLAFTGAPNRFNLSGTPSGIVEFSCRGFTPTGSSLTFQARVAGGDPWVTVVDGSTIGSGLATDVALAKSATYQCQVIFTPNGAGTISPVLSLFGVAEVATKSFDGLLGPDPSVNWSIDPVTLKAEIAEARFEILRDGERDYRSLVDELLQQNHLSAIDLRLWVGHPDLARSSWGLVETFQIDDPESVNDDGKLVLVAVSPLQQVKQILPVYNVAAGTRSALVYSGATYTTIYDDILSGQVGLPGRFYGPRLEDTSQTFSNTITSSTAKIQLDAIAFIKGGAVVTSQGRLKFVQVMTDQLGNGGSEVRAIIPKAEIDYSLVTPGFRHRIPEYFVPYGYNVTTGKYPNEARGVHAAALANLSQARIEAPQTCDDAVSRWLPTPPQVTISSLSRAGQVVTATTSGSHGYATGQMVTITGVSPSDYNGTYPVTVTGATTFTYIVAGSPGAASGTMIAQAGIAFALASRQAQALGTGIITLSFRLNYAHPEIEVGDLVAVQTDQLSARDPNSGAAVGGLLWAIGVVVGQHDALGTEFTVWVRSYGDLLAGNAAATRLKFALPVVYGADLQGDPDGVIRAVIRTAEAAAVRIATSTSADPSRATVQAASLTAVNADGNLSTGSLATLTPNQTLYVGILAYEKVDGTGAESATLCQVRITRVPTQTRYIHFAHGVFKPADTASLANLVVTDEYTEATAGNTIALVASIPLPEGVTVTEVAVEAAAQGSVPMGPPSSVGYDLIRLTDGGSAGTTVVSGGSSFGASFAYDTNAASESVSSGRRYFANVVLFAGTASTPYARFATYRVKYTRPSYYEVY